MRNQALELRSGQLTMMMMIGVKKIKDFGDSFENKKNYFRKISFLLISLIKNKEFLNSISQFWHL